MNTRYPHRILARVIIEAVTPMAVGSGEKDITTDALVVTDVNGLPYIPATAIAGVARGIIQSEVNDSAPEPEWTSRMIENIFGFQKGDKGRGSEIIFTEAKIIDSEGKPVDRIAPSDRISADPLLRRYMDLPIRQNVRITSRGTAAQGGKFDRQHVYAGTRFCFEIEAVSDGENLQAVLSVLRRLYDKRFRLGGGTRKGFGEIRVVDLRLINLDLCDPGDLEAYLSKSSALDSGFWTDNIRRTESLAGTHHLPQAYSTYSLRLTPDLFFLFGSGLGDSQADMTPVKTGKVVWKDEGNSMEGSLREDLVLIPAASVKGALAHRTAFHWHRLKGIFADDLDREELERAAEEKNEAVEALFGAAGGHGKEFTRGNVIFSDIILDERMKEKVMNHVALDPYTGGGREGALFAEKVIYGEHRPLEMTIHVDGRKLREKYPDKAEDALKAFQMALDDLCGGRLPLGGGVNRGHGTFNGTCHKDTADNGE